MAQVTFSPSTTPPLPPERQVLSENNAEGGRWMAKEKLNMGKWLAIAMAILLFIGPGGVKGFRFNPSAMIALGGILFVAFCVLLILVFLSFKKLLNEHFEFHRADIWINIFVLTNMALFLSLWYSITTLGMMGRHNVLLDMLFPSLSIPFGIASIVLATRLLKLQNDLYGMLKLFSYTLILIGGLFVTVIFSNLAFSLSPVSYIILAVIFVRARKTSVTNTKAADQAAPFHFHPEPPTVDDSAPVQTRPSAERRQVGRPWNLEKIAGVILLAFGVFALLYGAVQYTSSQSFGAAQSAPSNVDPVVMHFYYANKQAEAIKGMVSGGVLALLGVVFLASSRSRKKP
jgi:hypothetical protein